MNDQVPGDTYHKSLFPHTAIRKMDDDLRMVRMLSLQRDDPSRLDRHPLSLSRFQHLLGDVQIAVRVHNDVLRQRGHHTCYMQYPLRIGDLTGGKDTGRLSAGFLVAVAEKAVESGCEESQAELAIRVRMSS